MGGSFSFFFFAGFYDICYILVVMRVYFSGDVVNFYEMWSYSLIR